MVKTQNRQSTRARFDELSHHDVTATQLMSQRQVDATLVHAAVGGGEMVIVDDGKINAAVIEAAHDETDELARIEQETRKVLCGRPIHFKLVQEENGWAVSAVVPTYYSKQLLLRAVQHACTPAVVFDRICVPYPSCNRP